MSERPPRSLSPVQRHHRQAAWQIWLPVGLGVAIFLGLAVLAVMLTFGDQPLAKNWASLSVIWWILPSCLGGIISLAIVAGCVFAAAKGIQGLPELGKRILEAVDRLGEAVRRFSDRIAAPVIKANEKQAAWASIFKSARPEKKPTEEVHGNEG